MSYPGRVGVVCPSCGAELQEAGNGLRCPWAGVLPSQVEAGEVSCGRPYRRPEVDQGREYLRDQGRTRKARRA